MKRIVKYLILTIVLLCLSACSGSKTKTEDYYGTWINDNSKFMIEIYKGGTGSYTALTVPVGKTKEEKSEYPLQWEIKDDALVITYSQTTVYSASFELNEDKTQLITINSNMPKNPSKDHNVYLKH